MDDTDLVPIGLKLIGEDAGQCRADMLAHFGADDVDGDDARRVDAEPDRRLEQRSSGGGGYAAGHCRIDRREHARKAEGDAGRAARHEETPATKQ